MCKISVVIPFYNVDEDIFRRCIKSILLQSYDDYEIIIVDDGSDDAYVNCLEKIMLLDKRINVIHQENKGVSSARNLGINQASGDYITFVDADDEIVSYYFSEATEYLINDKYDMIIGGVYYSSQNKLPNDFRIESPHISIYNKNNINDLLPSMIDINIFFENGGNIGRGPVARFVKRELAAETLFNENISIAEDILWNVSILKKCSAVCLVEQVWYIYYENNNSATHKYNSNIVLQLEKGLNALNDIIDLDNDKIANAYSKHLFELMKMIHSVYLNQYKKYNENYKKINEIKKHIYNDNPWAYVKNKKIFQNADKKTKIKIILYNLHILFLAYKLK